MLSSPLRITRITSCVASLEQVLSNWWCRKQIKGLLFFTNDEENQEFISETRKNIVVPDYLKHIDGFEVFNAMINGSSHQFHKHGESWIGQAEGRKMWWFLPPNATTPKKHNACEYLHGRRNNPRGFHECPPRTQRHHLISQGLVSRHKISSTINEAKIEGRTTYQRHIVSVGTIRS